MINVLDKSRCCGCTACMDACNHNAIQMKEDDYGFAFPSIDLNKCIDCGQCDMVCPYSLGNEKKWQYDSYEKPIFYAGQLKSKDDLQSVSSGGACWAIVQTVIREGGVCYGAIQQELDKIVHVRVDTIESAKRLRRSKYLQSDTRNVFKNVKLDLKEGKTVLFCGTGCQVAALNTFLGKAYSNLYTCDVVCHGVPSQKVWRKYREEKEKMVGKRMTGLVFRNKNKGWSHNQYEIIYEDGSSEYENSTSHLFHAGYLNGLFYRSSCGSCLFSKIPRVSDISFADFWKYQGNLHSTSNDVGVSLIAVNTPKGLSLLGLSSDFLVVEKTEDTLALSSCRHMDECPVENPERDAFFRLFLKKGYHKAIKKYLKLESPQTGYSKFSARLHKWFKKFLKLYGKNQ